MSRIVVAGASGVLGARIVEHLAAIDGATVVAGDHRPERAPRTAAAVGTSQHVHLDVREAAVVAAALDGADAVVVTAPQPRPLVQEVGLELGVHVVDVSPDPVLAEDNRGLDDRARSRGLASVTMAGMFPGLSGLVACDLASGLDRVDHLELLLRQSANARVGPDGTEQMLRWVAAPVPPDDRAGLRDRHAREAGMRRFEHPERALLARRTGADVRYWTRWDSPVLTGVVSALSTLRVLDALAPRVASLATHDPSLPEEATLTVRVLGHRDGRPVRDGVRIACESDYGATASVATALTRLALDGRLVGAGVPFDLTTLDEVLPHVPAALSAAG
ncbi:NAD-dependent epimerase/dehydratase family protein [Georgenia sp. Z1344]|uniref:NAD-dependent epimerase/dehydratase family protein n=1 Tax=Georgenia sp. Z1344 TaxID=3416706 RepID=UPI003CECCF06